MYELSCAVGHSKNHHAAGKIASKCKDGGPGVNSRRTVCYEFAEEGDSLNLQAAERDRSVDCRGCPIMGR